MRDDKTIITRFPPSPTGLFHVGSARTALFNYLFAKQQGGEMVLRFEDTDERRSKKEFEQSITDGLKWLGIEWTGGIRQSERTELYKRYLQDMMEVGVAYESKEKSGERDFVIRFKNPNISLTFSDVIRGDITFDTTELEDFVLAKSLDEPLYHLAVVVDDYEMGITHIIRGEDHISNTARQLLIQEAIGATRPVYAHLPLILAPDKTKLSKRHGATELIEYQKQGYLPEALLNYLALLGWNPGGDREFFTMDELIDIFSLEKIHKGGAIFQIEKLKSINKFHIGRMDNDSFLSHVKDFLPEEVRMLPQFSEDRLVRMAPMLRERISIFQDITDMAEAGELEYMFEVPKYNTQDLHWKKTEGASDTLTHLQYIQNRLEGISESSFDTEDIKGIIWDYAEEKGKGDVLWPMRFALSGRDKSPDPFELAHILNKTETLSRLQHAIDLLENYGKKQS